MEEEGRRDRRTGLEEGKARLDAAEEEQYHICVMCKSAACMCNMECAILYKHAQSKGRKRRTGLEEEKAPARCCRRGAASQT